MKYRLMYAALVLLSLVTRISNGQNIPVADIYDNHYVVDGITYYGIKWGFSNMDDKCPCTTGTNEATGRCCFDNLLCEHDLRLMMENYAAENRCKSKMCPEGYYNPDFKGTCDKICPVGYVCPLLDPGNSYRIARVDNGFYSDEGSSSTGTKKPIKCPAGYYCRWELDGAVNVKGKDSTFKKGLCPMGYFCPSGTGSPVECPSGYYCPSVGASSPIECPLGYYCAITGSSTPTGECTASTPCTDDIAASDKAACAGAATNDCYRYLSTRSVSKVSATSMSSLISSATANFIYRVDLNGIFNQFGKKEDTYLVTGGKHLIIDCHDDYLQNFLSFNGSTLTLDANAGNTMNKIVFRHCVVLDVNLQLNSNSMIILHDSTIDYKSISLTTVDLTKGPAYIVVDDESHIIGLDAIKGSDISSKVMIIQDGSTPNAVFGCDKMLTCNSAPFVNNLGVYTDTYKKYFNYIATSLYANTTAYQLPNDAIASSDFQKRMVFQSQLSCGLYANQYHDRSVYFASALYCAVEDQTVEDSQYLEKIFSGVAYVYSTTTLATDEQTQINSILRAIQMRYDMQLQLRDRVIDITGMLGLGYALDQSRKDLALTQTRNFVSLFQGFKSESTLANKTAGVAYDNLMLKLEYTKKLAENSKKQATSYSGALDELMSTLPDEISKKIKDAEEKRLKAAKTKKIINIIKATLYAAAAIAACVIVGAVVAPGTIVIAGASAASGITASGIAASAIANTIQASFDATSIDPMISTLQQELNLLDYKDFLEQTKLLIELMDSFKQTVVQLNQFQTDQTVFVEAITLPISRISILERKIVDSLDFSVGCDSSSLTPKLKKQCAQARTVIFAVCASFSDAFTALQGLLNGFIDAYTLKAGINQHQQTIDLWNDKIQQANSQTVKFDDFKMTGTLEDQLASVRRTFHKGFSRAQIHSLSLEPSG